MKKNVLSLVLGLLMVLTALSSGVSADMVIDFNKSDAPNWFFIYNETGTFSIKDISYASGGVRIHVQTTSKATVIYEYSQPLPVFEEMNVTVNYAGSDYDLGTSPTGSYRDFSIIYVLHLKSGGAYTVEHYASRPSDAISPDLKIQDLPTKKDVDHIITIRPFDEITTINPADVEYITLRFSVRADVGDASLNDVVVTIKSIVLPTHNVQFSLKDALSGQSLTGVTVKEGNTTLGTINDGESLELIKGTRTLTFEKSGYWSETIIIDVQDDTSVSVEMYPSSASFKFLDFPSDIQVYENTIYELTFTISPFDTSAAYNTYLSLSGLSDVLEVKKAGQVITPESGKYYLGDISGDTQISIKFKAGSVGTHSFTITLFSNDAIMSSTYTTAKQVVYTANPLPFSVQMPSEWFVGTNEVRVSESQGQSLLIIAILKDANGTMVWSDSASLDPYAAHTFNVNVPSEGSYTLELQFNGQTASWDITVNPAITLLTETITASEGDIATVQVKINNPSSNTKYYDIILEGPIIEGNVTKSVSVAPLSEKTVDVSFQVPNELEYDAYDLNIKVYEGDALQYSDIVHLVIESGGFSLPFFGGGSSAIDSTWLWLGAGVLALFVFIMVLRRR